MDSINTCDLTSRSQRFDPTPLSSALRRVFADVVRGSQSSLCIFTRGTRMETNVYLLFRHRVHFHASRTQSGKRGVPLSAWGLFVQNTIHSLDNTSICAKKEDRCCLLGLSDACQPKVRDKCKRFLRLQTLERFFLDPPQIDWIQLFLWQRLIIDYTLCRFIPWPDIELIFEFRLPFLKQLRTFWSSFT